KVNNTLLRGYELLFIENNPAGVKAVLSELGITANNVRLPLVPLSAGVLAEVKTYLEQLYQTVQNV
ncbi:MAG TPA: dihydrodipicolinate synthase family protein, partial [Flavisolibacter sp.]|nr:dihydrodipicolinate synthase family protein [Flavisolibacter sp.]